MHASKDVYLCPDALPSLPDAKAASLDRLRDGDLVFADASEDVAGVCKSVEIRDVGDTEVVSGLHTIAARFDKTVLADGFRAFFSFVRRSRCTCGASHAGTKRLRDKPGACRKRSRCALPTVTDEQIAIAAVLSDMDAELAALEARRDKTRDLKQAMMQELLTGKTRLVPAGAAHA